MVLGNRPTPLCERTDPEIPIVFSPDQVTAQVEQIGYSSMSTQESLNLPHRLELRDVGPPHPPLSNPGRFMRLLRPIILILFSAVDRIGNQFSMGDSIASQFISHDFSGLRMANS